MKFRPRLIVLNQMAGPLTWDLVQDFARENGNVVLLTGHPDTLEKAAPVGLRIFRSASYLRGGMLTRSWSWLRYLVHAFFWIWKWPADVPLLIFSNPPMLVWLAWTLRLVRGTRYAVMVHDIYPDCAIRMGVLSERHVIARLWRQVNRWAYNQAEAIMTLGRDMAQTLQTQFDAKKVPAGHAIVVHPWADTTTFRPVPKAENAFAINHAAVSEINVMYSGNMGHGHDIESMLDAARAFQGDPRVRFFFIGAGPKWTLVEQEQARSEMSHVTLLPWLAESQLPLSMATADVALVSLEPELAGLAIPSKAFTSLAVGSALIVMSDKGTELAQIVLEHECGWVVRPGDVTALTEVLRQAADDGEMLARRKAAARRAAESIGARHVNSGKIRRTLGKWLLTDQRPDN